MKPYDLIPSSDAPLGVQSRDHAPARRMVLAGISGAVALLMAAPAVAAAAKEETPLRQVLEKKRVALQTPQQPQLIEGKITAESRSGVRRLRIGDHQYLSDSERDYAGYNLGAGSWDTFAAVLASAIADEYAVQAAARRIPLDAIDVVFTSRPDTPEVARTRTVSYPRNLAYVAYLDSPASDAQLEQLRRAVEESSAVLSIVRDKQPLDHGRIELISSPAQRDPDLPPGLRDFLVEKRTAILRRQARAAKARAEGKAAPQGEGLRAHAHVEPNTGIRNTRTGELNFQIVHDGPAGYLGYGIAPNAEQHIIGVLGTCLTHIFEIESAKKQAVLDGLELSTRATLTPRPTKAGGSPPRFQDISYSVRVESPESAATIEEVRNAVEGSCPIYNLLKDSQGIEGRVVHQRYDGK